MNDTQPTNDLMVKNVKTRDAMIDHDYDLDDFEEEMPKSVSRWSLCVLLAVLAITVTVTCFIPSPYVAKDDYALINHALPDDWYVSTPFVFKDEKIRQAEEKARIEREKARLKEQEAAAIQLAKNREKHRADSIERDRRVQEVYDAMMFYNLRMQRSNNRPM